MKTEQIPTRRRRMTPSWGLATIVVIVLALLAHYKLYTLWGAVGFGNKEKDPVVVYVVPAPSKAVAQAPVVRPAIGRRLPIPPVAKPREETTIPIAGGGHREPATGPADGFLVAKDAIKLMGHMKGSHLIFSVQNLSPRAVSGLSVSVWGDKGSEKPDHTFDVPLVAGYGIIQGDIEMGLEGRMIHEVKLKFEQGRFEK